MSLPNILLIVLDTTRARNLSCYGYSKETSPNLDRIAEEGVLFSNAITNSSWTLPAHASLFTGTYPSTHLVNNWNDKLSENLVTIAQFFRDTGYQTIAINNNSWINEQFGLERGFDVFIKMWLFFQTSNDLNTVSRSIKNVNPVNKLQIVTKSIFKGNALLNLINGVYGKLLYNRYDLGGKRIVKAFENWLHRNRNPRKPFFMFINLLETHLPYKPLPDYLTPFLDGKYTLKQVKRLSQEPLRYITGIEKIDKYDAEILTALYDAEIKYLDSLIGSIYNILSNSKFLKNTILVIVGDHGENIGEHNMMSHFYCLYDTVIHIPFIMRYPAELPKAKTHTEVVQLSDIFPTLAAMVSLENRLPKNQIEGKNIFTTDQNDRIAVSELLGVNPPIEVLARKTGIAESELKHFDKQIIALRNRQYKYIQDSYSNEEFFDISKDPYELQNIIQEKPELHEMFRQFKKTWDTRKMSTGQHGFSKTNDVESDLVKRLEALGYL